jgi:4-amino-4-deoxy-L-arabinose transferase-like glycosyltransferase
MQLKMNFPILIAAVLIAGICAFGYAMKTKSPHVEKGDTPDYIMGAYHLRHHGTFSQVPTQEPVPSGIGREPGYAFFLAALMFVDPAFAHFSPACLTQPDRCGDELYRVPQIANSILIGLSGFTLFAAAWMLTGNLVAAGVAGGYLLLNFEMHKDRIYLASDYLGLWLLTLTILVTVWAARKPGWWRWTIVGTALALLVFVKAVFLYFTIPALLAAGIFALAESRHRGQVGRAALVTCIAFTVLVGSWFLRNESVSGQYTFTDQRSGIALSTREVFNHMSAEQYAAAFVYWTRGFGDSLAVKIFPSDVVAPFDLGQAGGFYDTGQNGYGHRVNDIARSRNISLHDATEELDRMLLAGILANPFTHLVTTLPVFYRGIWIDEFIVIGLPIFLVMLVRTVRRRDWMLTLLLSAGAFNLMFYALISLNIPRYQITAVPSMALATGIGFSQFLEWRRSKR